MADVNRFVIHGGFEPGFLPLGRVSTQLRGLLGPDPAYEIQVRWARR